MTPIRQTNMINVVLDKLNSTFAQIVRENKVVPLMAEDQGQDGLPAVVMVIGAGAAALAVIAVAIIFVRHHRH